MSQSSKITDVHSILQELFSFHRFGIKPGLENITTLLEFWDNPHRKFPAIHLAGTNGKGSVSSLLAAVLRSAGYSVGLYTSPHIRAFNERIRVNGIAINDEDVARLASEILPETRKIKGTFFEATTAIAFRYFAEQKVDFAVVETGMGGNLDSTNVVEPILTAITSIDFDHTEFLGDTLEKIAFEKAGIFKSGIPALVAEPRMELRLEFMESAVELSAPICFLDDIFAIKNEQFYPDFTMSADFISPKKRLENVKIGIAGTHQGRNALTAFAALELLKKRINISEEHIRNGFADVRSLSGLHGRIELLTAEHNNFMPNLRQYPAPILLDVAHNSAGVKKLAETLTLCGYNDTSWTVIFAAMNDKPADEMLPALKPFCGKLYACAPDIDRATSPQVLSSLAKKIGIKAAFPMESVEIAVQKAVKEKEPILIVGSFYLADSVLFTLEKM